MSDSMAFPNSWDRSNPPWGVGWGAWGLSLLPSPPPQLLAGSLLGVTFLSLEKGSLGAVAGLQALLRGLNLARVSVEGAGLAFLGSLVCCLLRCLSLVMSPNLFLIRLFSAMCAWAVSGMTDSPHCWPSCVRGSAFGFTASLEAWPVVPVGGKDAPLEASYFGGRALGVYAFAGFLEG